MPLNLLQVKPFQETEGMCGPASLKMVFEYYGVKKTEAEIAKMCGTTKKLGTNAPSMERTAKELGFKVVIKQNSSFHDIQRWLNKKVPVIVDWFTRGRNDYTNEDIADGHYSVVVGLDKKYIYLQDPELGKIRKMRKEDFLVVWFDFKGRYIKPNELVIREIMAVYR